MTIITADGQAVQPVNENVFLIGVAQTYDVVVKVPGEGAYEFRATAHDGSGTTSAWLGAGKRHPAASIPNPDLYIPMGPGGMARFVHYQGFETGTDVTAVRDSLRKDPLYFYGTANILSNMTEGELILSNSRYALTAGWDVGWHKVEDTDWEGLVTADYHLNRFTSFFGGVNFSGEGANTDYSRGVWGLRYLLPLNFESAVWGDTDGGGRFMLEKKTRVGPAFCLTW